jgi:hypothetical protein
VPENPSRKSRPILWVVCALPYVILVGYLGSLRLWALWSSHGLSSPVHITDLTRVKIRTHLTFPSQAVLEDGYEQQGSMPTWFIARVRVPHSQVSAFLAQTPHPSDWHHQRIDFEFQNGFRIMRDYHWSLPSFHKFQSALFKAVDAPASSCAVLVDQDNTQNAIVYIYSGY